jgi:hypothetical protein
MAPGCDPPRESGEISTIYKMEKKLKTIPCFEIV